MTDALMKEVQSRLDAGSTKSEAARECGISEACIRYHEKKGNQYPRRRRHAAVAVSD